MLTASEVFDEDALAALIASAVLLGADLKAGLYTNVIAPSKVLTIADMVEPPYASYVRQSVVMGPVMRDPINDIAAIAAGLTWQQTGVATPCIIQGVFYVFAAAPKFMGIDPFPTPIPLNDTIDAFVTVLEYIQSSGNQGFTTVLR